MPKDAQRPYAEPAGIAPDQSQSQRSGQFGALYRSAISDRLRQFDDYEWQNGAVVDITGNGNGGNYSVEVTDALGCTATAAVDIEEASASTCYRCR